ncbi:hypothetical protein GCM10011309_13850 [Litorimonas cladophorae]|uniref:Uncharacterized protein n=2 Tax=Litorimonas cladophorae TaxID=1220491 RepID=A0A918KIS9_9PROT|nr:hypothetical protein GCM10011309_13850 [Litorimonas cladophorae]
MLFFGTASAKQEIYQAAPFKTTYCFFDGEDCEDLPTYIRVVTTLEKNKVSGFKKNEKILSIKSVDQKASWEKDEILILREKYKKKYKKALRAYIEFADQASSQKKLFPRNKIASFKYAGNFQTFRTFSRFEDDHYLVITSSTSRVVFNQKNAELLLNFLNDWDFEGEIQATN